MKVFVTGASGFIGRAFCREAQARGFELLCLTRDRHPPGGLGSRSIPGSLAEMPWTEVERFAPEAALHLAWIATPGVYLRSPLNAALLEQSKSMLEGLAQRGVAHLAVAGSCIEYAPGSAPLRESSSPTLADSPYAEAKCRLHDWLADRDGGCGASGSWLRIFYPYGPGEDPGRLTTSFLEQLAAGEPLSLRTPASVKDFIFVSDLARALCCVLEARLEGAVNLGTGTGTSIRRIAELCAVAAGADRSLVRDADEITEDPRPRVVADTTRIRSTGWRPSVTLEAGVDRLRAALERRTA